MPCLLRFFKYFIFTVIGSSILQPLNVVVLGIPKSAKHFKHLNYNSL